MLISLQGEHLVAEIFAKDFSVTIFQKISRKPPLQPPLLEVEVLMDVPYN
jgi:hypothetical protein